MARPLTDCKYYAQDSTRCARGIQGQDMCFYHYNKTRYTKQVFTQLDETQRKELIDLYISGFSANQVAEKIGRSKRAVLYHVQRAGVSRSSEKSQGIKYAKVRRGRYSGLYIKHLG